MGAAISQRLRQNGFDVAGWDQNADACKALANSGLRIVGSPREVAAASDIILSIITEDHGVRHIFTGSQGFLSGDVSGKLFVEMSTLQPMTGRELAPLVEAKGARLIKSPVLGTIPQVRDGKLFALSAAKPKTSNARRRCWKSSRAPSSTWARTAPATP